MTNFDDAQLRRLDVTLLLVFEEAMASGKLSAAAKRLGLTQSAISHAIGRLREVFKDELFMRTPRGVQPTPRALALRAPLAEALRLIGGAIRPASFDPARDERVFRVAASDYETALFAPLLLGGGAGASRFIFRTLVRRGALDALQAGDIDLLLGYTWPGTRERPATRSRSTTRTIWWSPDRATRRLPSPSTSAVTQAMATCSCLRAPRSAASWTTRSPRRACRAGSWRPCPTFSRPWRRWPEPTCWRPCPGAWRAVTHPISASPRPYRRSRSGPFLCGWSGTGAWAPIPRSPG
jgi:DNA-binding transcriptional LysR family regulator